MSFQGRTGDEKKAGISEFKSPEGQCARSPGASGDLMTNLMAVIGQKNKVFQRSPRLIINPERNRKVYTQVQAVKRYKEVMDGHL
jgi:hypothetical protein